MNQISRRVFILLMIHASLCCFVGCAGRRDEADEPQVYDMEIVVEPSEAVSDSPVPPTASMPSRPGASKSASLERSAANKKIQRALKKADFYRGAVDGMIGPGTRKAIEDFQRSRGLVADGKVGPKTWSKLKEFL
ncbi:peptidoglycan-binding protein [Candidatus Omnitrophota bacterium]